MMLLLPAPVKTCCREGCNEPRLVTKKGGRPYSMCEKHQKAAWSDRRATPADQPKRSRRGRKPKQAAPPPRKLMLIDYEGGVVQLLQLEIVNEVKLHDLRRGEPHPHTIGFYEHIGYQIAEIRPSVVKEVV